MTPALLLSMLGPGVAALGGSTTWNPADKGAGVTLSSSDRVMAVAGGSPAAVRSTIGYTAAAFKYYAEAIVLAAPDCWIGFGKSVATLVNYVGFDVNALGYKSSGGVYGGAAVAATYATYAAGDAIGLALNGSTGDLWWSKNGVWQAGDPGAGTPSGLLWDKSGTFYIMASADSAGSVKINCGQEPFQFVVPTGFTQWG